MQKNHFQISLAGFGLAVLIAAALSLATAGATLAQSSLARAVVIVVDGATIQAKSLVGQDISRQIDALRTKLEGEISIEQTKLREEGEALQAQFASLAPEQLAPRQRQFDAKVQAFRRMVEDKQAMVQRSINLATNEVDRSMRPILREIMNRRSANFVFDKTQIILSSPSLEVTDDVIEMLDKKLPTLVLDTSGLE